MSIIVSAVSLFTVFNVSCIVDPVAKVISTISAFTVLDVACVVYSMSKVVCAIASMLAVLHVSSIVDSIS